VTDSAASSTSTHTPRDQRGRNNRHPQGFIDSLSTGLYLSGAADAVQPPAVSRKAAQLSASSFELIDGGGHAMMADAQEACDRVRQYCEAVLLRPGGMTDRRPTRAAQTFDKRRKG
jgi:hypothetical protein